MLQALTKTKGRRYNENFEVAIQNPFLEDFCRILRCPSFRRLGSKTQVMTSPQDYFIRTRLSHTLEVIANVLYIAESLGLNMPLCKSGAALHDTGHAPYGHLGESVISEITGKKFHHKVSSVIVAQHLENKGKGLNLSYETLEAALYHSRTESRKIESNPDLPHEYNAIMWADKITYTSSDINDSIRYGYLKEDKLPDFVLRLGKTQDERDFNVLSALIKESKRTGLVQLTQGQVAEDFNSTRNFMFNAVYHQINNTLNKDIIRGIYDFFKKEPYLQDNQIDPLVALVLLTDEECNQIGIMMMGSRRFTLDDLKKFSIFQYLHVYAGKKVDFTNPDLDWGKERIPREI